MRAAGAADAPRCSVHNPERLERVFLVCFAARYRTRLIGGATEPLYLPAGSPRAAATDTTGQSILYYREDYFASALHEVAHWCIAGPERRLQEDFGYWYAPEGRGVDAQQRFQAVESRPQALEWLFSLACGFPFQISFDNPGQDAEAQRPVFARAILGCAQGWQAAGLPSRAGCFFRALGAEFGRHRPLQSLDLTLEALL